MTCIGRSNQFFVNNAGVRFNAGLIENAITSQPGIAACGIAPEFHKTLHDNVPILYVETSSKADELGTVRKALIQVFIHDGKLADTNLPSQCVLTDSIPLNSGGKVDTRRLASACADGRRFNVKHVKLDGKVDDIILIPAAKGEAATMGAGIPEELENDPYNILSEIFAAIPEIKDGGMSKILRIPGMREMVLKLTDFDVRNIPESMRKMTPKLLKLSINQPLSSLSGDFKLSDITEMLKMLPSAFPGMEFPMFPDMEAPKFPMPMPMVPPMLPVLPVPPMPFMPFWGWGGKKKDGKTSNKRRQAKAVASDDAVVSDASDAANASEAVNAPDAVNASDALDTKDAANASGAAENVDNNTIDAADATVE